VDTESIDNITCKISKSDAVLVSFITPSCTIVKNMVNKLKKLYPDIIFIGGGKHITHDMNCLKDINFDYIVMGEGEISVPNLINYLDMKRSDNLDINIFKY